MSRFHSCVSMICTSYLTEVLRLHFEAVETTLILYILVYRVRGVLYVFNRTRSYVIILILLRGKLKNLSAELMVVSKLRSGALWEKFVCYEADLKATLNTEADFESLSYDVILISNQYHKI